MEDIRIYDFEFNLLHIEHNIISSNWTINYNDIGTWEAHFDVGSGIVPFAMSNKYLVAVQGTKQAIITGVQANAEFVLYGRTVNWILSRRMIGKFTTSDYAILDVKDVESIARWVMQKTFIPPPSGEGDINNFVLGGIAGFTVKQLFWRNTKNAVSEVIKDCLDKDGGGHRVVFDIANKKWVFEVLKGRAEALPIIISEANKNAYETEYTEDLQDFYTSGWYERTLDDKGDWNGSTNAGPTLTNNIVGNYGKYYRVSTAGTQFGIAFKEGDYIVCRNKTGAWEKSDNTDSVWEYVAGDKTGIYKWDCKLSGSTENEAKNDLKGKQWNKTLTLKTRDIKFLTDYNLGDIVKVQKQVGLWKTTYEKRITGVNLWYENNNIGEQPIFEEV